MFVPNTLDHGKTVFILGPRCKMALVILLQKQLILTFAFNVHTKNFLIHSWNKKFVFMILCILPREGNNLIQARLGFFQ